MPELRTIKYWQAINEALAEEMQRDQSVVLYGQDVAQPGGTFGESRGLLDRFGAGRVRDAPISEAAMVGAGVGAAMMGLRPIVELIFIDFLGIASDQLVNQAAKLSRFSGGQLSVPLVIKAGVGTELGMGAQHSQALEGWYAQVPGLKVCWAATPADAKGLLKAAVRDDGPVLYLESLASLRMSGPVGDEDDVPELGRAAVARHGDDVTLVTYGTMRAKVEAAAELLAAAGVSAEVIDLRTVQPWDRETVFGSVARTGRCAVVTEAVRSFGPSAELACEVAEHCFDDLDAPVVRVASPSIPAPQFAAYDAWRVPQAATIAASVGRMLGLELPLPAEAQATTEGGS